MISYSGSTFRPRIVVWVVYLPFALAPFLTTGCGQPSDTVTVQGDVTFRGKAISKGSVTFYPETGRPANAPILDGAYQAELRPAEYVVTISISQPLPPGFKEGDPEPPPKLELPPVYTIPGMSTLKATVTPDQNDPIDFVLE